MGIRHQFDKTNRSPGEASVHANGNSFAQIRDRASVGQAQADEQDQIKLG